MWQLGSWLRGVSVTPQIRTREEALLMLRALKILSARSIAALSCPSQYGQAPRVGKNPPTKPCSTLLDTVPLPAIAPDVSPASAASCRAQGDSGFVVLPFLVQKGPRSDIQPNQSAHEMPPPTLHPAGQPSHCTNQNVSFQDARRVTLEVCMSRLPPPSDWLLDADGMKELKTAEAMMSSHDEVRCRDLEPIRLCTA
ncbi:uncharacterized protein BP01DRAFT_384321 [Aspergillus saccharolyticus JOP 1030-1]|uniref:Uncharacterized protein n=1 Tax=Aspergillus saccharolyticus JOP 1030-1 TaxID=1450539 RepID=A0A318ZGF4_9EURO|nr:hypothetical protein BP01DRAFT_384321 [Aspergillus saccharolyticus JOP 1030-1]PYH43663.1 hypothetical protein BP01DRAFT_384321 [Aspergillus saccharolyticus JOP 1030-1]